MNYGIPATKSVQSNHRKLSAGGKMSNEVPNTDNLGNPIDWNIVLRQWISTDEAMNLMGLSSVQGVVDAINQNKIRGVKLGSSKGGRWYIEPQSADDFERTKRGRPPKSDL